MEDKVSVALFEKYANEEKGDIRDKAKRWMEGGIAHKQPTRNKNKSHPVYGVMAEDAWRFAQWMGGELPTMRQWDKAAGEFEERRWRGPYDPSVFTLVKPPKEGDDKDRERWRKEVARLIGTIDRDDEGPKEMAPPGEKIIDRSWFGVRYMTGDGGEFTRDLDTTFPLKKKTVPLPPDVAEQIKKDLTSAGAGVIYRGKAYWDGDPYEFVNPKDKDRLIPDKLNYFDVRNYVSFRVVLEQPS